MSKIANFNSPEIDNPSIPRTIDTGSDSGCGANLSVLEHRARSALEECEGCGRRFVPTGPQRFCDHACYSKSLRVSIERRFWTKVNKNGPVPIHQPQLGQCWLWTAATIRGYGQIAHVINGKKRPAYAHRLAWEMAYGPIPDGLSVLHRCDVPLCVRPDHLFLGTQQDNLEDARAKGRLDETLPRTHVLTLEDRIAIFEAPRYRGANIKLARDYGVTKTCITHIRKGRFAGSPVKSVNPLDAVLERVPSVQLPIVGELHVGDSTEADSIRLANSLGEAS